jgi:ADP-heptose:LPS heptosyltransferase
VKILVVRFSSIGDIVLTTPVVRCLAKQLPGATIHYLTKRAFEPVLRGNPYINELKLVEKSVSEIAGELAGENYDVIVDLHNNIRTLKLKWKLRRRSYAFPKKNVQKLLLTKLKIDRMPDVHVVDRYFEAVRELGVQNDGFPCDFFLGAEDEFVLPDAIREKTFTAVAMGAQYETKQMPVQLMADILSGVELPVVLLGGNMDKARAAELMSLLNSKEIIDFCGKLSIRQSAFVLSKAAVLLTGDTGLMHIATAFRRRIVSVWGNTVPQFGMYPYSEKELYSIHEVDGLSCRPCSKIGYRECPKGHFNCMHLHNPEVIASDLDP